MSLPAPPRLTIRRSFALAWRTLRSMRTALVLLCLLAAAAAVGSLLPQIPNSPERVASYRIAHPGLGDFFARAGFFDVFGSWWFALILALLFVSLVACLIPRSRAMIRSIRQRPIQAREIDAFPQYREFSAPGEPMAVAATARTVLRRHGYRVAVSEDGRGVAAEKGALREAGSLIFHWAFVLLLVSVIVGKGTGYVGHATIVEGATFTDAAYNYGGDLRTGRFSSGGHTGIGIRLIDFADAFRQSGVPMDFSSKVELLNPDGTPAREASVTINHPVSFGGVRIFQYGFGWAPVITVRDDGRTVYDGPVVMGQNAPEDVNPLTVPWVGFIKLSTQRPQVAIQLELYPDSVAYVSGLLSGTPQPMTGANAPFMRYVVWQGKEIDPSLSSLDTRFMRRVASGGIGQGWTVDLGSGCVESREVSTRLPPEVAGAVCPADAGPATVTMSFPELKQYSRLQISRDTTVPFVLAAAILILAGLIAAMYSSRRKVWVRAEARDGGSVLQVGGFALQRKDRFEEAFPKLVDDLAAATARASTEPREEVGAR
jgi:cytochrome c biogenesis protein